MNCQPKPTGTIQHGSQTTASTCERKQVPRRQQRRGNQTTGNDQDMSFIIIL
ncbi:hypothetical protein K443DRAFT_14691 [Laccaria amethystina LaAM-08-1]|uniref:Uncharacterized protein n=1 Tax=Laccaria amethystina LaAM-08-1 TaxID=1095629 RepID=A0A0C9WMF7_9AGAR|nr:hypothetical protein K443DRAFT_14691 [Laccaria amethystina LaAM-08-1]